MTKTHIESLIKDLGVAKVCTENGFAKGKHKEHKSLLQQGPQKACRHKQGWTQTKTA